MPQDFPMIIFPHCKINIGLQVISRREDGFHDIATVFYPLPLTDVLEIITANKISFHATGIGIPGDEAGNLCLKAYHLLQKDFPDLPPVSIHLHKAIPIGAGLGGGSSDAAFTLRLLNEKYHLDLSEVQLSDYAIRLGSDCAFFLQDKPCYATGRGNELSLFTHGELSGYQLVVVCPDIHVDTAWAYNKIAAKTPSRSLPDLVSQPVANWRDVVINDFETPVFEVHPILAGIKEALYTRGAYYASMSGSGSAIFGIFPKDKRVNDLAFENAKLFFL
jgi:4-diphosphocytidyl-2-C-methyl-D-erythritol kinase